MWAYWRRWWAIKSKKEKKEKKEKEKINSKLKISNFLDWLWLGSN